MSETESIDAQKGNEIAADTRPTKKLLIEGITRDITVEACIFDLIDNAIDAKCHANQNGLIELTLDGAMFSIRDYGSGIALDAMIASALRFGTIGQHIDGIGAFGVGLNRALFKLGKEALISSETCDEKIQVNWDVAEYMQDNEKWHIPISVIPQEGVQGTFIQITKLNDDVSLVFSDHIWVSELLVSLSKSYGYLIKNSGLSITVNDIAISAYIPMYRECDYFKLLSKNYSENGVSVEIILGRHEHHLFGAENLTGNETIKVSTDEFGWTVYCNGRAILLNDWSSRVGWDKDRHTQYYGFVGIIHLRGEPQKLPWSTSKSNVDLQNLTYINALKHMRDFSEKWRSFTDKVKRGKIDFNTSPQAEAPSQLQLLPDQNPLGNYGDSAATLGHAGNVTSGGLQIAASPNHQQSVSNKPSQYNVGQHPNQWEYLFGPYRTSRIQFKIPKSSEKLLAVVNELQKLEIKEFACSIMLLMRVLIEESCKHYSNANPGNPELEMKGSLAKTVKSFVFYLEKNNILTDGNEIAAIKSICTPRGEDVISIEYLQNSIHSKSNFLSGELIRPFWRDIQPFIKACCS